MSSIPLEIERKFVILKPDFAYLSTLDGYSVSQITQTYIASDPGITHRVRARVHPDRVEYSECKKTRIAKETVIEDERRITEAEYNSLRENILECTRPIHKERTTFRHGALLFEVDVYPQWQSHCIMEVELPSADTVVDFPPFITVVKEVTGIKRFSNASMSKSFPEEESI